MKEFALALVELIRPYLNTLWAVLSVVLIKDAEQERNHAERRAQALQDRMDAKEYVDSLSDADVERVLKSDRQRV